MMIFQKLKNSQPHPDLTEVPPLGMKAKHLAEDFRLSNTADAVGESDLLITHHFAEHDQLFDPGHLHVDFRPPGRGL